MRLSKFERQKLFSRDFVIWGIVLCCIADFFLLFAFSDRRLAEAGRELVSELGNGTPGQQLGKLSEKYDVVFALNEIDEYVRYGTPSPQTESILRGLLQQYGEMYENSSYPLLTSSYRTELQFLATARSELSVIAGYRDFLRETQEQVENYSEISIFGDEDSFSYRNMVKAAEDYSRLAAEELDIRYFPQQGLMTALNFRYTDFFILLSAVLISGLLICEEKETGITRYVLTFPNGRSRTAVAKYAAMSASLFGVVSVLYGINLCYCAAVYGLGPLTRHVQSLPFLMRFTYPIRIWQYLLIFFFAKWLVSCVLGGAVLVIFHLAGSFLEGTVLSLGFYGANAFLYQAASPNTALAPLRYINPAGMLRINDWMGTYLNYDVGGQPLSSKAVIAVSFLLDSLLFPVVFASVFSRTQSSHASLQKMWKRNTAFRSTTVQKEEWFKNLVLGGGAVLLTAGLVFSIWSGIKKDNLLTGDELYYGLYVRPMSGPYDEKCRDEMKRIMESEEFQTIDRMERLSEAGLVSPDEYKAFRYSNYDIFKKREAFDALLNKAAYVKDHPGAQIMYETGYRTMFDFAGESDRTDMVRSLLLVMICCCNVFCQEHTSGMDRLLGTLANGKKVLLHAKHRVLVTVSTAVAGISVLERTISVCKDFGLPAFFAPAMSMEEYSNLPVWVSVFLLYLLWAGCRFLACYLCALVTSVIAVRQKKVLPVLFFSSLVVLGPILLCILGIKGLENVGLYPLFHLTAMIREGAEGLFAACHLAASISLTVILRKMLLERYGN